MKEVSILIFNLQISTYQQSHKFNVKAREIHEIMKKTTVSEITKRIYLLVSNIHHLQLFFVLFRVFCKEIERLINSIDVSHSCPIFFCFINIAQFEIADSTHYQQTLIMG